MQPYFDPVIILNHNVHGKDTGKTKASYNTKWTTSMAQDMMATEPSLSNGMVIVDYGGSKYGSDSDTMCNCTCAHLAYPSMAVICLAQVKVMETLRYSKQTRRWTASSSKWSRL